MIDHDHNRAFVRPLVQAVEGHGQAFAYSDDITG